MSLQATVLGQSGVGPVSVHERVLYSCHRPPYVSATLQADADLALEVTFSARVKSCAFLSFKPVRRPGATAAGLFSSISRRSCSPTPAGARNLP
jgi:hypothetical protein